MAVEIFEIGDHALLGSLPVTVAYVYGGGSSCDISFDGGGGAEYAHISAYRLRKLEETPPLPSQPQLHALRGKMVDIKLDADKTVTGVLIRWSEDGEVVYRDFNGTVWHAWPMLHVELADA